MKRLFILPLIVMTLSSCNKDQVDQSHQTRTASAQQTERESSSIQVEPKKNNNKIYRIRGTYYLDTIEVDKAIDTNAKIIDGLGNIIADIIFTIGGGFDVEIDPIPLDVSDVDLEVVKEAIAKKIKVEVLNKNKKTKLNFLKKIKLYIAKPSEPEKKIKLLDLRYKEDNQCNGYCIEAEVSKLNLVDYVDYTGEILIIPEVSIGKVPKDDFRIQIGVDFQVGLILPL